jgi:hypothetical protein
VDWPRIEKLRRSAVRRVAGVEYQQDLEDLLIRYASALDQPNPDVAFLQMWSILEKMTDTVGDNYDETIKRAVSLYSKDKRAMMRDILELLRLRRNQYVHSAESGMQSEQLAYAIKSIIDPHFLKLISNPFKVRSLEEYGAFLALPTDLTTLDERRRRIVQAIRFRAANKAK